MADSLLPSQILPPGLPFVNKEGKIDKNWWLFLYALSTQQFGTQISNVDLQQLLENDLDVPTLTDAVFPSEIPDPYCQDLTALLAAEIPDPISFPTLIDDPLPPPVPRAQPESAVTPSGSPFTYTAAYDGWLIVNGGTVSLIEMKRSTAFYTVGIVDGVFPLAWLDQIKITYTVAPTCTFFPR